MLFRQAILISGRYLVKCVKLCGTEHFKSNPWSWASPKVSFAFSKATFRQSASHQNVRGSWLRPP